MSSYSKDAQDDPRETPEAPEAPEALKLGQAVRLKSSPASHGFVIEILPSQPENRFRVLLTEGTPAPKIFYASQLEAKPPEEKQDKVISRDAFRAHLTSLQIQCPSLSTLYSLNAARVDFVPYQYRPVFRFMRSESFRLLIADGVGVGKTIEACLILRELQARRDVRSVLIICPRPLVTEEKWQSEMRRFEEHFTPLDGPSMRQGIQEMDKEGVWPESLQKIIIPYSILDERLLGAEGPGSHTSSHTGKKGRHKGRGGLLNLNPPPRFDLVIVDEAHHVRNPGTLRHKAVKFFCDHAEAVVFLTATPIQLGSEDLFVLLNMLRPDLIQDKKIFDLMAEPNPLINKAVSAMRAGRPGWHASAAEALRQSTKTSWGEKMLEPNPSLRRLLGALEKAEPPPEERVKMIRETEELYTFANLINRTRRRDIESFTVRKSETVPVNFTPIQKSFHDRFLKYQAEKRGQTDYRQVKFAMTMLRRRMASCLWGLVPFLEAMIEHLSGKPQTSNATSNASDLAEICKDEEDLAEVYDADMPNGMELQKLQEELELLLREARSLEKIKEDPKLQALRKILHAMQERDNNKVMLFSTFRHTLNYLFRELRKDGFRVGLVHGGTPDEERIELRARFEKPRHAPDGLDLLLFSEVGCEGLDYQFCSCMVNYDLPWNPMRVEQRIGRIDRKGQKSSSVVIYNFITPGTIDADIYERCLQRIGVFDQALGASEEILGQITSEIKNIAENYTLSPEESKKQLQQLADNKIRLIQEEEELEDKEADLFGVSFSREKAKKWNHEVAKATSFWLSAGALREMLELYLKRVCNKTHGFFSGEGESQTLRLAQEDRARLLVDFRKLPRQRSLFYRAWETWLQGSNLSLRLTFDSAYAMQNPRLVFITPHHPFVRQAALFFEQEPITDGTDGDDPPVVHLEVTPENIHTHIHAGGPEAVSRTPASGPPRPPVLPGSPGSYGFVVYQWHLKGLGADHLFKPMALDSTVDGQLQALLEAAWDCRDPIPAEALNDSVREALDRRHHELWREAVEQHQLDTRYKVSHRLGILESHHRERLATLERSFGHVRDERIQNIYKARRAAFETDYQERSAELEAALNSADIFVSKVAYGVLHVSSGGLSHAQ